MKAVYLLLVVGLSAQFVQAQEASEAKWSGETEASAIVINGNSDSETYSAKTKNTYKVSEMDLAIIFGKYIQAKTAGVESNKAWDAGLRYERVFTKDLISGFIQHKAEHDPYNGGYVQRDSTDLGGKYYFIKNDTTTWLGEVGYRSQNTYAGVVNSDRETVGFARLYTEIENKWNPSTTTKIWVEHLPNLKKSDESQSNAEVSLSVAMNNIFSLKTSYLLNRDEAIVSPAKKDTTTWTTALVAKY